MGLDADALLDLDPRAADRTQVVGLARQLEQEGRLELAATGYDLAFGLQPSDPAIAAARLALLDRLSVTAHGLRFRYVPAGTFLMGSETGDGDERPVRAVRVADYWLAETPLSWASYCELMDWQPPPLGLPRGALARFQHLQDEWGGLREDNKIRLQYCENATTRATDWHSHLPRSDDGRSAADSGATQPAQGYDLKPMVAVGWQNAEALCARLSTGDRVVRLPSEAEWEKAARGGLIGRRYPWGDEPPDRTRCDFDRFRRFSIQPMRAFPPNGYGLYAMSGCVWEWTADWYAAAAGAGDPPASATGGTASRERILRGGSWADCGEAVTVSFRMSWPSWAARGPHSAPNFGFRLCMGAPPAAGDAARRRPELAVGQPAAPDPARPGGPEADPMDGGRRATGLRRFWSLLTGGSRRPRDGT